MATRVRTRLDAGQIFPGQGWAGVGLEGREGQGGGPELESRGRRLGEKDDCSDISIHSLDFIC